MENEREREKKWQRDREKEKEREIEREKKRDEREREEKDMQIKRKQNLIDSNVNISKHRQIPELIIEKQMNIFKLVSTKSSNNYKTF